MKDAANTKLGHIYFEQVKLMEARKCYIAVSPESRFYDEALLGLAWVYIKGGAPQTFRLAQQSTDQLISSSPKSRLRAEAYLAKGYASTMLGEYDKAADHFQKVIDLCAAKVITDGDVDEQRRSFNASQANFKDFQTKAFQLSLRKPTKKLENDRDKMKPSFDKYEKDIKEFALFLLEAKADAKFRRSISKLKEDANYALATIRQIQARKKGQQIMDKRKQELDEIEEEIRKLQEEGK
jgi:hypothetical protein